MGRSSRTSASHAIEKKREPLLVCAPSNAAVDEITRRLSMGVSYLADEKGKSVQKLFKPSIVRLGVSSSVHSDVRDVSLEYLLESRLKSAKSVNQDIKEHDEAVDKLKVREKSNCVA